MVGGGVAVCHGVREVVIRCCCEFGIATSASQALGQANGLMSLPWS
jgi:hypothetical protein